MYARLQRAFSLRPCVCLHDASPACGCRSSVSEATLALCVCVCAQAGRNFNEGLVSLHYDTEIAGVLAVEHCMKVFTAEIISYCKFITYLQPLNYILSVSSGLLKYI